MAPTCPKCDSTMFEITDIKIHNANFLHHAIICRTCGCIVGTEEYLSVMNILKKIADKLGVPVR